MTRWLRLGFVLAGVVLLVGAGVGVRMLLSGAPTAMAGSETAAQSNQSANRPATTTQDSHTSFRSAPASFRNVELSGSGNEHAAESTGQPDSRGLSIAAESLNSASETKPSSPNPLRPTPAALLVSAAGQTNEKTRAGDVPARFPQDPFSVTRGSGIAEDDTLPTESAAKAVERPTDRQEAAGGTLPPIVTDSSDPAMGLSPNAADQAVSQLSPVPAKPEGSSVGNGMSLPNSLGAGANNNSPPEREQRFAESPPPAALQPWRNAPSGSPQESPPLSEVPHIGARPLPPLTGTSGGRALPAADGPTDVSGGAVSPGRSVTTLPPGPALEGVGTPGAEQIEGPQTPQLLIQKIAPDEVQVGVPAVFRIHVVNSGKVPAHDVEIYDTVPRGTKLLDTSPRATVAANGQLIWKLGTLNPGDEASVEVSLEPITEGEIGSVATVRFAAEASVRTVCTKPELTMKIAGPDNVLIGSEATLVLTVSNPGSGVARNVVIEAELPPQLSHPIA